MELGPLRALTLDLNFDAHGTAVVVTRPYKADISTTGIWQRPLLEDQPIGRELTAREPRRVMALRRDEVPEVERGTVLEAAESYGGDLKYWQVDGIEKTEPDYFEVRLVPKTEANKWD